MEIHELELAWAAGFFDGEGTCYGPRRKSGTLTPPRVTITQVDRRNLERFQRAVLGMGQIRGPVNPHRGQSSDQFIFTAHRWQDSQAIIALLWTWLGPAKRDQAKAVLGPYLDQWESRRARQWTCKRGHRRPAIGARCKPCDVAISLRWRATNRDRYLTYMRRYWKVRKARRLVSQLASPANGKALQHRA